MARRANDRQRWLNDRKREAERAYSAALASGYEREALIFKHAAEQLIEHENPEFFNAVGHMSRMPVTIDEFMDSGEFLGCDTDEPLMEMWPKLRPVIRSMNPDVFVGEAPMHTILMGGATGWGKTHAALATNLYQVYLLSCFDNPHALFGLNKSTTPIVFMFMTVSGTVTKRVLFQPFRAVWTNMPYAKRWTRWDRRRESELVLDNNVHIVPALASLQSMVGQAICGAITDEISFMSIVEESKQVAGNYGMGGRYDQADIVFSNITRRRARSFTTRGVSIGCVCAPSSTRYKGDYIDQKMAEAEELQTPGVLTQRYKQYDIAPLKDAEDLLGKTFRLLVGTDDYPTRVLHDPNETMSRRTRWLRTYRSATSATSSPIPKARPETCWASRRTRLRRSLRNATKSSKRSLTAKKRVYAPTCARVNWCLVSTACRRSTKSFCRSTARRRASFTSTCRRPSTPPVSQS
jgi:hypothetical protein